jgi:hypothetical protein
MSDVMPPIPPILDQELLQAVSALARSADSLRSLLAHVAWKNPKAIKRLVKHSDRLFICDAIISCWCQQLDLEDAE